MAPGLSQPDDARGPAVNERSFHLLMGALLFASTFFDRVVRSAIPAWNPPVVSLLTLVIGLVWVGLFAAYRVRLVDDQARVLRDRAERAERKIAALEDAVRRLHGL